MGLNNSDFLLSDKQLDRINCHFDASSKAYAQAGEDAPSSVKVVFEWIPGLGRFVGAYFDGETNGCTIEDAFDD